MPISPMDEFLAHQTSDSFDRVFTSDRNFYDRHYFNCFPIDGELFLITGMGQYPNLGVSDAFVTVSLGQQQFTVRASRELGVDRLDTQVGPFSVEVVEGLRKLRWRCARNEWGIAFDLLFEGSVPAQEEPKTLIRSRARVTQDVSRYAQIGTYRGWLEVAGRRFELDPTAWRGVRDHSWGIRPVGEREAPGIGLSDIAKGRAGFYHNWLPMHFDDGMLKVMRDEDCDGHVLVEEAVKVWRFGIDRPSEPLGHPEIRIVYQPGTREIAHSEVRLQPPAGKLLRVVATPLRTVYLAAGSGYVPDADWGHGYYKGPLAVEGLTHDFAAPEQRRRYAIINETLCRFELDSGEVGYGMHENMCLGVYRPAGFDTPDAVAP